MSASLAIVFTVGISVSPTIAFDEISAFLAILPDASNNVLVGASASPNTFHEIPRVSSFCCIAEDGLSKNTTSLIFCGVIACDAWPWSWTSR